MAVSLNKPPQTQSYFQIFVRFLRFGLQAWGGPVAQIAMLRKELVEEEHWVTPERFNRSLAVYQVLPGPEAHEMCVYFGMVKGGRLGGFLAGLAFMLPGFVLMFILSWLYMTYGFKSSLLFAVSYGLQPAVAALIISAVHRISKHSLTSRWLWGIGIVSLIASLLNVHFSIILIVSGLVYVLHTRRQNALAVTVGVLVLLGAVVFSLNLIDFAQFNHSAISSSNITKPSILTLFHSGLRSGLLTFGGAYTVIPFLQNDAVVSGGWLTNDQFLDGLAISGMLPAPLIIFATFVGYLAGGPLGAIVITVGIFLPAFAFTLLGHDYLEKIMENKALTNFLDGVTAGVVGMIAATSIGLFHSAISDIPKLLIFAVSLVLLYQWKVKTVTLRVILCAGLLGYLVQYLGAV